ncbi:hypothetical protein N7475_009553 [Penicillium sp. IBT 31633x]|nr:hypothetical protein N7475_009553 [Penicillium sp. IBT 31633x]
MSICHAEDVRLMLFAFRNGNRKDFPPTMVTRPFEVVKDGSEVASQVQYEVLTKDRLGGIVDNSEKHNSTRHLGYDDGHFRVHGNAQGYPERKSDDGSAFTSRLSKEKGKPVGKVQVRVDSGSAKQCRSICNMTMSPSTPGQAGVGASGVRMRSRQVEFFVSLNRRERFQAAGGSRSVSERPLELFIGFDGKPSEIHSSDAGSVCAAITGMDMEVYYNLTED